MLMRRPIIKNQPPFEVLKPFLCELSSIAEAEIVIRPHPKWRDMYHDCRMNLPSIWSTSRSRWPRGLFKIAGNKYRIVVWINYPYRVVYVRFIGTHWRGISPIRHRRRPWSPVGQARSSLKHLDLAIRLPGWNSRRVTAFHRHCCERRRRIWVSSPKT